MTQTIDIEGFRAQLSGIALTRGDIGYDEARGLERRNRQAPLGDRTLRRRC